MNPVITKKDYPIRKRWILKNQMGLFLILLIIAGFIFFFNGGDFLSNLSSKNIGKLVGAVVLLIVATPVILILSILRRATFHYSFDEKFINAKQGIFSKQEMHMPYGRIQNVFVKQDFWDRVFGLAFLYIETAGMDAAAYQENTRREAMGFAEGVLAIPGLSKNDAEVFKNAVLQRIKENPIEDSQSGL